MRKKTNEFLFNCGAIGLVLGLFLVMASPVLWFMAFPPQRPTPLLTGVVVDKHHQPYVASHTEYAPWSPVGPKVGHFRLRSAVQESWSITIYGEDRKWSYYVSQQDFESIAIGSTWSCAPAEAPVKQETALQ